MGSKKDIRNPRTMATGPFKIDKERAREVAKTVVSMYHKKVYPFNQPDVFPDTIVPEGITPGSREHAFHVFYACSIDSMRRATEVYKALRAISQQVDITNLWTLDKKQLEKLVVEHLEDENGFGNPAETFYYNSRRLYYNYDNSPIAIAIGINRTDEAEGVDYLMKRLAGSSNWGKSNLSGIEVEKNFRQVGFGKAALIVKNFVRFGFWNLDPCQIYVKPDRHLMRICLGTGVVETQAEVIRSDRLVKPLGKTLREITQEERISAVELDDALWAIGTYSCMRNNKLYCGAHCDLGCYTRPDSDNRTIWFYPGTEKRRMARKSFFR